MTEIPPISNPSSRIEEPRLTYHQYGFRSAQHANSRPDSIDGFLDNVYDTFLDDQRLDEAGLKDRVSKLKSEIQQLREKRSSSTAELATFRTTKVEREKQIEDLELEKIAVKKGEIEDGDTVPFIIASFIVILLTLYLFVFYSSSGYTAMYGVKLGMNGFLNADAFNDALVKGPSIVAIIILFPVIFLGLGFLVHDSLDNNKKLKAENKSPRFGLIVALVSLTFVADAFIGYTIAKGIHNNEYMRGGTDLVWQPVMVLNDVNFFLVLLLGFVVYVIWGFLLHYVLSHPYLKTESEKIRLMVENMNRKIEEKRQQINEIVSGINKTESDISNIDLLITEKGNDIIGYENGVIPVNVNALKGAVGEFMGGWQSYTNGNLDRVRAEDLVGQAIKISEKWLENKLNSLKGDR